MVLGPSLPLDRGLREAGEVAHRVVLPILLAVALLVELAQDLETVILEVASERAHLQMDSVKQRRRLWVDDPVWLWRTGHVFFWWFKFEQ